MRYLSIAFTLFFSIALICQETPSREVLVSEISSLSKEIDKLERSMAKKLSGTVKEILGTCNSIGCTVNGDSPRDVQAGIDDGEIEIPDN